MLELNELQPLASLLDVDPNITDRYQMVRSMVGAITYYTQLQKARSKGGLPASVVFDSIAAGQKVDKIYGLITQRIVLGGLDSLTKGELIAKSCFGVAAACKVKGGGAPEVFLRCADEWPEPLLSSLRTVGAERTADLILKWFERLFPDAEPDLSPTSLAESANRRSANAGKRKEWLENLSAVDENVESMTREYLIVLPELFQ